MLATTHYPGDAICSRNITGVWTYGQNRAKGRAPSAPASRKPKKSSDKQGAQGTASHTPIPRDVSDRKPARRVLNRPQLYIIHEWGYSTYIVHRNSLRCLLYRIMQCAVEIPRTT